MITALSQFAGLKVIARHSAFQFRNSRDTSAQIGTKLGVAHLLEGSVQRAGDTVRITATLVKAADGSVVWTQHFDRPYKDLFALQDVITAAVASSLQAKLLNGAGAVVQSDRPPSGSVDAYVAYQHGIAYRERGNEEGLRKAVDSLREAIRLDPKYAAAYAQLSYAWIGLAGTFVEGAQAQQAYSEARRAANKALVLDPNLSLSHQAQTNLLLNLNQDWAEAEVEARRAIQLAPTDPSAQFTLAGILAIQGKASEAAALTRQALASDPRQASRYFWLSTSLTVLGQFDAAQQALETSLALQPGVVTAQVQLTVIAVLRGDAKAAIAAAGKVSEGVWRDVAMALAQQIGGDRMAADAALNQLIANDAAIAAYQIAQVYALRGEADNTFRWLDRAWNNHDTGVGDLLSNPFILRYRDDPRFAAFCKKIGLPTATDAAVLRWK